MNNVREIKLTGPHAALRAVLLHRPDAHPHWHTYQVAVVHLRPVEGLPPPKLAFPDGSHEISILAVDPRTEPNPDDLRSIQTLHPPNMVSQLRALTDEGALALFGAFVKALSTHELCPDSDHFRSQLAWLERWQRSS